MEKYLKWEDCNEEHSETLPASGKVINHNIKRKIVCSHPEVEKCWQWGGLGARIGDRPQNYLEILTKDGQRYSESVTDQQIDDADFPKAEEWLQSLNTVNQ